MGYRQVDDGADLATWLQLNSVPDIAALPPALRRDLARAALIDDRPGLALALADADTATAGTAWASDVAARALLALGRPAEALERIEARHGNTPTIDSTRLEAQAFLALGEQQRARAIVARLVEKQPEAVSARCAAGEVALALDDYQGAEVAFSEAAELSPNSVMAAVGLARVELARGDAAAACARLEPIALPTSTTVRTALVEALAADGRHEEAAVLQQELSAQRAERCRELRGKVAALLAPGPSVDDAAAEHRASTPGDPATGLPTPQLSMDARATRADPLTEEPSPTLAAALREYFGFDDFRAGQAAVCQAMLDGHDTLAVMPTGAGKSLCFQLPAMLLDGVTLVISPLVALMKDQLDSLPPAVYERATLLNSTLAPAERDRRIAALADGQYRLVYVAPERLGQPSLFSALRRAGVARVVVDEAHCVSAWGHDFRPDYLAIGSVLRRLDDPPLLAVTATASPAVRADIGAALGRDLAVVQTPMFRPNLRYEVQHLANVEAKLEALVDLCRAERGSAIVYANSRRRTEELAQMLRRRGVQAAHYHAGLAADERGRVQDAFMLDRTRVIVATVAFGMGVDKANIRLVAHFSLPDSLEAYVQESGRAGRDGRTARCVLLTAPAAEPS